LNKGEKMKKIILSLGVATFLLTTSLQAKDCPTTCDRVVFGTIGVIQGLVIGGPVGAFWGLGTIIFADNYEASDCNDKSKEADKKKPNEIISKDQENSSKMIEPMEEKSKVKEQSISVDDRLDNISQNNTSEVISKGYVVLPSIVLFEYDSYTVQNIPQKLSTLKNDGIASIKIDGHTDSVGSDEYNFALGLKRANAVKNILIGQGIETEKLSIVSYGESSPISKKDSENRRVDLNIKYSAAK
jgi:peptidoglycan-associated lipoprotein